MKPSEIEVGKTYANRGKGKTQRKVLAIGAEYRPTVFWNYNGTPPNPEDLGVLFEQKGKKNKLYLGSFAAWCGREVETGEEDE